MPGPYGVVVVPGLGGSQLSYRGGAGGKTALWYNPGALVANTPLGLALDTDGVSPYPVVGKTLFPDGPVALGIYEPLLTSLAAAGYNPRFWSYDWRLDLPSLATAFTAFLRSTPLTNPFTVVCHSMGGIIAQLAYPAYVAPPLSGPTWKATAYLNTPHGGSHWATLCLNGIFYAGNFVQLLGVVYTLAIRYNALAKPAHQALALAVGTLVGSWPSVYQLCPNQYGPWRGLDPLAYLALQPSTYADGPGGVQTQWLRQAANVMNTLVANYSTPRPFEMCLNGIDFSTPAAFSFVPQRATLQDCFFSNDGDGTVFHPRAVLPLPAVSVNASFTNTNHNGICNSLGPVNQLVEWIEENPTGGGEFSNTPTPLVSPPNFSPGRSTLVGPLQTPSFANVHGDP